MISFNGMALRSLYCADVPLRNCSLTQQISALVTNIMLSVALFFSSAWSVWKNGNYNQWYWHSTGTDWLWHTPCCYGGNAESVSVNHSISWLINIPLQPITLGFCVNC